MSELTGTTDLSILAELKLLIHRLAIPVQTGGYMKAPPATFLVLIPLTESFPEHADDEPQLNQPEVRLSLYTKGSYTGLANTLVRELLRSDFSVINRQYIEYESDTGYHHYEIDVTKVYPFILNPADSSDEE